METGKGDHGFGVLLRLLEAVHVSFDGRLRITNPLLVVFAKAVRDLSRHESLFIKFLILRVTAHLNDSGLEGAGLDQSLPRHCVLFELPVWEHHVLLELAFGVEHEVLDVADLDFKAVAHAFQVLEGIIKDPSGLIECLQLLVELSQIGPEVKKACILQDLRLVVLDSTRVVVRHNQGFADLTHENSILRLALKGTLVVDNGLFRFLDIHQGLCDELEVLDAAFSIEDFEVAASVIVAIFKLIQVDLSLLLLCLNKAAIIW